MKKLTTLNLLLLFLFFKISAQEKPEGMCSYTLYGTVIDEHDNAPLGFATVYIQELEKGVITDENGNYKFDNLCEGKYTVQVNHIGCEPIEAKVVIKGNTHKNFYPEHHSELLNSVEILSEKAEEKTTQAKAELTEREMNQVKGKTLGEALKEISGVNTIQTGNSVSKPVIHGLHSNRILIMNNGVRQEGQQWGTDHAPEIDPFIAGKLTVVKGANSVRYGSDALAGIILVQPKSLSDSAGIGGEINTVASGNGRQGVISGVLDGNFKKLPPFSWRVQGTLKQGGNILTPGYYLKNTGIKEYNFSYALGWKKPNYGIETFYSQFNTRIGIYRGSHIGNLTDLQKVFESNEPLYPSGFSYEIERPYQHIEHELFKAKSFIRTGNKGILNFQYARQYNLRYEYDAHAPRNDSLAALNKPDLQLEITTHTGDVYWEHNNIKSFKGSLGGNVIYQGNTYEGRFFIPNFKNYGGGLFWIERFVAKKYELEGGVRFDQKLLKAYMWENGKIISPELAYSNLSGSAGVLYKVDSSFTITGNIGTAWRAPAINELYGNGLHHGTASVEIGDKNLLPERAYNSILTFEYKPGKKIKAEISVYYNFIRDFIYLEPTLPATLTIKGAFPTFYFRQTNADFKGMDGFVSYNICKQIDLSGKASLLRARNLSENEWLVMMPSDRYETAITYNFSYKKMKEAYISLSGLYVTQQIRVPANSDYLDPPPAYFLLNLESGLKIPFYHNHLEVGFGIRNVMNASYRDYLDRFRYYTDAIGRNYTVRLKVPLTLSRKEKGV